MHITEILEKYMIIWTVTFFMQCIQTYEIIRIVKNFEL